MTLDFPLRILPGDGIVARSGHFIGFAPGSFAADASERIESIFGSYEESSSSWEHLVRTIATSIIEANFSDHPPVVAVLLDDSSIRIFVYGAATLTLDIAGGDTHRFDGTATSTWIDQRIDGELVTMSAGDPAALGADLSGARGALHAGIVPGAGFALAQVAAPARSSNPAPSQAGAADGSEPVLDNEATIEPIPRPASVADAASTLLGSSTMADANEPAALAPSPVLDTEFRPDVTATIGPNELAEIRAAVAAYPAPVEASPPPPSPEPTTSAAPPPPPIEAAPSEPLPAPPARVGETSAVDLRDLPPPPIDRRTPAGAPDTVSFERSPYAPPEGNEPPTPADVPDSDPGRKRRGIFAAVPGAREAVAAQPASSATVTGVRCPQGHLNRMQSSSCVICGTAVDPSSSIEQGERPALGKLRFDDGQTYQVDRPYVLGRRPESSAPGIGIIVIDDDRHMVSKRHAEIRIVGWDVKIVDLGSSNGTKVFPPGGSPQQAIRLRPNVEVVLEPGSHIQVGERTFQYLTEGGR